ncbi:MAG: hydroxyacid dehydrogenase, partial [Verrucomicrobia bacterium]
RVVFVEHGYATIECERQIVTAAGGEFLDANALPLEEALRRCEDADAILVRWLKITPQLIKRFRRCKIIIRYGVGFDNVDVDAATAAGIIVGHVPNYCTDDVSTHAIALLLACVRQVVPNHSRLAGGGWDENPAKLIWRTAGRALGLVGFGNIAQAVARKMRGWDMKMLATDPYVDPVRAEALGVTLIDLDRLCREADYISLHVPLLPETHHLIGAKELGLMKTGAILINTARGKVLDTQALLTALNEGRIAQAALDVFEEEPPPADSPLRTHPRIVSSDHVAWYSEESQMELKKTAAEEAVRVCQGGLPISIANPEVLHRLGRFAEWTPNDNARWRLKRIEALKAKT